MEPVCMTSSYISPIIAASPEADRAQYDFDFAIRSLRQAIDFAEIEHDVVPCESG
jgi:hypothetical protein